MPHVSLITTDTISWNSHVSHPMQSWEWGAVRKAEGKTVVRFAVSSHPLSDLSSQLSAVYQMTLHPIPYTGYSIGYIPKSSWPTPEFLRYLKSYCLKHQILFVKFEPGVVMSGVHTTSSQFSILNSQLRQSPHPLFTSWNQVLDISKSEGELLGAMHPKTRYNIKLATKKGVTVSEMSTDEGYAIFEKLYFDTTKRQGYRGHMPAYHRNIWRHLTVDSHDASIESQHVTVSSDNPSVTAANAGILSPSGQPERSANGVEGSRLTSRILIAFFDGEPLAAFQVWHFKNTFYYTYGGSSEKHRNLMAANLLMWEVVRLGRSLGAYTLDMWGSLPPDHDVTDPWAGFTRFKSGYGTQFIQYVDSYDLTPYPLLYRLYNIVQTIRIKVL